MSNSPNEPYSRDRQVDKPSIAGARWWHDSLADQAAQIAVAAVIGQAMPGGTDQQLRAAQVGKQGAKVGHGLVP